METPYEGTDQEKFENFLEEMDWLDETEEPEFTSQFELMKYRAMQNPAVPMGCIATAIVLGLGLTNFVQDGPPKKSQTLMRWRVGLQGATIGALIIGTLFEQYYHSKKT